MADSNDWRVTISVSGQEPAGQAQQLSGGPVIDADGHALAGILVEGAERGRFDRFVPVTLIARVWPGLPRPWLITGAEPGEAPATSSGGPAGSAAPPAAGTCSAAARLPSTASGVADRR